jgi:hypothetical protein
MRRPSTRLKKGSSSTKSRTRQWRRLVRGLRSRGCGRLFAPASIVVTRLHSSNEKPRPGETGALRTEGGSGGVGGCLPSNQNLSLFILTAALPPVPPHLVAKDRRDPSAAPRRDRRRRSVSSSVNPSFRPRMILRARLRAKAIAYRRTSPLVMAQ